MTATSNTRQARPIIFTAAMVRAILIGKKTQTRRVVKDLSADCRFMRPAGGGFWHQHYRDAHGWFGCKSWLTKCPYGTIGDRLWVRETWALAGPDGTYDAAPADGRPCWPDALPTKQRCFYRATEPWVDVEEHGWQPSTRMPRWASRLTLEITSARVQRLQDISNQDAKAEGVEPWPEYCGIAADGGPDVAWNHLDPFIKLWESIYKRKQEYQWRENPLVWVVEFKIV